MTGMAFAENNHGIGQIMTLKWCMAMQKDASYTPYHAERLQIKSIICLNFVEFVVEFWFFMDG